MKSKIVKRHLVFDMYEERYEFDTYQKAYDYLLELKLSGDYCSLLVVISNSSKILNNCISDYKILENNTLDEVESIAYKSNIYVTNNKEQTDEVIEFLLGFNDFL